jgi:hypothetical protein
MGHELDYVFRYAVAESDGEGGWREIPSNNSIGPLRIASAWLESGRRIWKEPNPDCPQI